MRRRLLAIFLAISVAAIFMGAGTEPQPKAPAQSDATAAEVEAAMDALPEQLRPVCTNPHMHTEHEHVAALIEALRNSPAPVSVAASGQKWQPGTAPKYLDLVDGRFQLQAAEKKMLLGQGIAVLSRQDWPNYAEAYWEVHRSQLPIYVSIDSVLHAIYQSNDSVLKGLEGGLAETLSVALARMHAELPAARAAWPAEVARDVDLYLAVGRLLLDDAQVEYLGAETVYDHRAVRGYQEMVFPDQGGKVADLVAKAREAKTFADVELFGRKRVVDFKVFQPTEHYQRGGYELQQYYRGAMWLSRLELNVVSRGSRSSHPGIVPDPRETPREALDALALADLAERAKVSGELATATRIWDIFAGRREDLSLNDLTELRKKAGITDLKDPSAFEKLKAAIGDGFKRTAHTHPGPDGVRELPVIASVLGPRIPPDLELANMMVHDQVTNRYEMTAAEFAYLLGQDRAKTWLAGELARFPGLGGQLDKARGRAAEFVAKDDLYGNWFAAIRALGTVPKGELPSIMGSQAFQDLRVNTVIAAYGQLRHNYQLMTPMSYETGGCEIPDGYVEPALATYDALIAYAARARDSLAPIASAPRPPPDGYEQQDVHDLARADVEHFTKMGKVLEALRAIVREELAGRPLSEISRRFLAGVVEANNAPGGMYRAFCVPQYSGWYFDLFPSVQDGLANVEFSAMVHRSRNTLRTTQIGVDAVRLGLFVVDTGGEPRLVVGPVTEAWFNHVSDAQVAAETRPDGFEGDDAPKLPAHESPWARTYTVPSATAPSLEITCGQVLRCTAKIAGRARELTLVRMDYHHQAVEEVTHLTGAKPVEFVFTKKIPYEPKTLFVRAGEWSGEVSVDGEQPLRQPEICDDGVDNDGNGLADCLDPACKSDAACAQLDCASPKCGGADVWKSAMCRKLNANCGPGCSCGARRRR